MEDSDRAQEIERRYSVKGRIALFFLIFAFGAAILTARLYQLQITQGEELAEKTEAQRGEVIFPRLHSRSQTHIC